LHLSDQLFWQKAIHWIEPKLSKFPWVIYTPEKYYYRFLKKRQSG
jgi:hypothetical protein